MTDNEARALGLAALEAGFDYGDPPDRGDRDNDGVLWRGPDVETPFAWPDLRDPATLGVLLAQVREAWPFDSSGECATDAVVVEVAFDDRYEDRGMAWTVVCVHDGGAIEDLSEARTEAHALVAALKAAKEEP